jgi:hypothetical protein
MRDVVGRGGRRKGITASIQSSDVVRALRPFHSRLCATGKREVLKGDDASKRNIQPNSVSTYYRILLALAACVHVTCHRWAGIMYCICNADC